MSASRLAAVAVPVAPASVRVDLTWTDNSNNKTASRSRGQRTARLHQLHGLGKLTVGANVSSYSDTTVAPNTTYFYRVSSSNANGASLPSNTASVTTPNVPPAAPTGLTATPSTPAPTPPTVTLGWTDNANNENGFTDPEGDQCGILGRPHDVHHQHSQYDQLHRHDRGAEPDVLVPREEHLTELESVRRRDCPECRHTGSDPRGAVRTSGQLG